MTHDFNHPAEEPIIRRPWFLTISGGFLIIAMLLMPILVGEADGEQAPDLVRFLGRFHPVLLHLPIGIFTLIFIQEFLILFTREKKIYSLVPIFIGASTAVLAMALGFLLYQGGGFEGSELVKDHLWGGVAFACFAVATFIGKAWTVKALASQAPFRILLLLSMGVMGYASHDGASITHGANYLTKYAPDPIRELLGLEPRIEKETVPDIPIEQQVVYADIVAPILEMRCVECHNEEKSKGNYRMDTYDLLLEGGKEGEGLEAGNALDSNIIFRSELPEDDEEHMPPEGKTDIKDHELAIVKWWIDEGASPTALVSELNLPDDIRGFIEQVRSTEDRLDPEQDIQASESEKDTE